MARIVLANVAQDDIVAGRLEHALVESGHEVVGRSHQPADASWALSFAREILQSDCVVGLVSPAATESARMMTVMSLAERRQRCISVVVGPGEPPRHWTTAHCVDLRDWSAKRGSKSFKQLLQLIKAFADPNAPSTAEAAVTTAAPVSTAMREAANGARAVKPNGRGRNGSRPAPPASDPGAHADHADVHDDGAPARINGSSAIENGFVQTYPHGPLALAEPALAEDRPAKLTVEEIAHELLAVIDPPFPDPVEQPARPATPPKAKKTSRAWGQTSEADDSTAPTSSQKSPKLMAGVIMTLAVALFAGLLAYAWRDHREQITAWESADRAWLSAQSKNTVLGYTQFLETYPASAHSDSAEAALAVLRRMGFETPTLMDEMTRAGAGARRVLRVRLAVNLHRRGAQAAAATLADGDDAANETAQSTALAAWRATARSVALLATGDVERTRAAAIEARALWTRTHALRDDEAFAAAEALGGKQAYENYQAAFPNGRHADKARARMAPKPPPSAPPSARVAHAPTARAAPPGALHPQVAEAAARARDAADAAAQAAKDALASSQQAKRNAALARNGQAGYGVVALDAGTYAGPLVNGRPSGQGVLTLTATDGPNDGEYYAGAFVSGVQSGLGIYAAAASGGADVIIYAGEWTAGDMTGRGVMNLGDGVTVSGSFLGGRVVSNAVAVNPGGRYEGEWFDNVVSGYGVLWDKEGKVQQAGFWRDYELIESL